MVHIPVSISIDFSVGALTHNMLMPPAVPTPVPVPSIEMICTIFWPPGYAVNQNKLTTKETHKGMNFGLDGHDCGMLIPDVTIPPANLFYAIMWPFSSRKYIFAASAVKAEGTAVGCATLYLPLLTCGDPIGAPTTVVMLNLFINNTKVNLTLGDFLAGLLKAAVSMLLDFAFSKIPGVGGSAGPLGLTRAALKESMSKARDAVASRVLKEGLSTLGGEAVKKFFGWGIAKGALGSLAGFGIDVTRREVGDNQNVNPTVKVAAGNHFFGEEVNYSYDGGVGVGANVPGYSRSYASGTGAVGENPPPAHSGSAFGESVP